MLNTLNTGIGSDEITDGTEETKGDKYSRTSAFKLFPSSFIHSVGKYLTLFATLSASIKK